jgi:hypothetical protein
VDHSYFVEIEREHAERLFGYAPVPFGERIERWTKKRRQVLNHICRQREQGIDKPKTPMTGVIPGIIAAMSEDELAQELQVVWDDCCCYIPVGEAYNRAQHIQHLLANLRRWQTMCLRGDVSEHKAHQAIQQIQKKLESLQEQQK